MFPANCCSCLHVGCLGSTVADSSTDQPLKFQHSSVKTKVSKTTFKNGCQYRAHPVYFLTKQSGTRQYYSIMNASTCQMNNFRAAKTVTLDML